MRVIPISLPTPFYIGPVNVYLIAEDPITIIDTGPKTKATVDALRDGLRSAGFRVSDIRRIVLTHAHEDHCGLAKSLRDEAKNAEVFVHDWETGLRHSRLQYDEYLVSLARLRACSPTMVYGGHGDAIRDYEELFHRYFRAFQERQSQVVGLVKKSGVTAWEVGQAMFPGADDVHRFLAVSEAVAHLDLAHSEGKIGVELAGQTEVYKPKDPTSRI